MGKEKNYTSNILEVETPDTKSTTWVGEKKIITRSQNVYYNVQFDVYILHIYCALKIVVTPGTKLNCLLLRPVPNVNVV